MQVTLLIEQPEAPSAVQFVRAALLADKTVEIDIPLLPDAVDICNKEIKRLKEHLGRQSIKGILKTMTSKKRSSNSRVRINEETEDIPVASETNPNLLIKVPAVPPVPPCVFLILLYFFTTYVSIV
ncbi:hypothetical protein AB6A40_000457 [Gnathostoma spinigerum]|uniref:Uncharacterized protein n=1 Tax=Gnathostoma spinigerum TaxID=75299 RepID=A0ABD6E266_9BILA